MGMFNYVEYEMKCPKCGRELNNFQTKDGEYLCMDTVQFFEVDYFYDYCDCGQWLKFQLQEKFNNMCKCKRTIKHYELLTGNNK